CRPADEGDARLVERGAHADARLPGGDVRQTRHDQAPPGRGGAVDVDGDGLKPQRGTRVDGGGNRGRDGLHASGVLAIAVPPSGYLRNLLRSWNSRRRRGAGAARETRSSASGQTPCGRSDAPVGTRGVPWRAWRRCTRSVSARGPATGSPRRPRSTASP